MKKGNRQPGKQKNPTCSSTNLILCKEPLRKVLGKIGHDKLTRGDESGNKKRAIYELLSDSPFTPTDEEVKAGIEIVNRKGKARYAIPDEFLAEMISGKR